jgi:hypothetical protein
MRGPHYDAERLDWARCWTECRAALTAQSPALPSMPAPSPLQSLRKDLAENLLPFKVVREGECTQVTVGSTDLLGLNGAVGGL